MAWLEAIVMTSASNQASVETAMNALGALAVTLRDAADEPLLEPPAGATPLWSQLQVIGLFPEQTDPQLLEFLLKQRLPAGSMRDFGHRRLADQVWERTWLRDFVPQTFGSALCICPSHCTPPADIPAVLYLDPGLAFGTGSHATTWLCLQHLASRDLRGRRVIDYGCGSGILALAALKLGAAEAWAVDNDPQALTAAADNAERNQLRKQLRLAPAGEAIGILADVLVANILAGVLCRLAGQLGPLTAPGGELVLSGILLDQVAEVRAAYEPQFGDFRVSEREGWALLSATRN